MKKAKKKAAVVIAHVRHFLKLAFRNNISALAGRSAFFILLSLVPLLMFAFSVASLVAGQESVNAFLEQFESQGSPAVRYLAVFLSESINSSSPAVAIVTAIVVLWSAGKGMYCITDGIARVYQIPDRRLWVFRRIYAMGYTVTMLLMLTLGLAFVLLNSYTVSRLTELCGGSEVVKQILSVFLYILIAAVQALMMTLALKLYLRKRVKNPRYRSVRALLPGMLLTIIAWKILSVGITIYIRNFAASSIYGSLGTVFIVMVGVYFMMYILLYGIQLDYIYRRQFSQFRLFKRKKKASAAPAPADGDLPDAPQSEQDA